MIGRALSRRSRLASLPNYGLALAANHGRFLRALGLARRAEPVET